jgi:outer membrane protein OmpA-like peptidoglycan-associated protein
MISSMMKTWLFLSLLLCAVACQKEIEFNVIHFTGYTDIAVEDSALLYENLQLIQDHPKMDIKLRGYTDSIGEDSVNMVKSYARADTINAWLVRNGVDSLRLLVIGCGEQDPIGDNHTAEGRALNNRVEFVHHYQTP